MTSSKSSFADGRQMAATTICRPASFGELGVGAPQRIEADGTSSWIMRGANFIVMASRVAKGSIIAQDDIVDESMLLLAPAVPIDIMAGGERAEISDEAVVILPPGSARIAAQGDGLIIRVFSSAVTAFAALAGNADAYAGGAPDVVPLDYWPKPVGGFGLRVYRLADHSADVGFGRLFRSTNLMVNIFHPSTAARDLARLSPHEHADFEQGSLTMGGDFVHYLRTPWSPDRSHWRADREIACSGCSLLVIPPRMIHTTSWSTTGARLIDIFGPPRDDFSLKPWVRNAADYPLPDRLRG